MAERLPKDGVPLTDQAQLAVRHRGDWCGEHRTGAWARLSLPSDVNELSVDERSSAFCRLPTSLKNEDATLLSFSVQ
jgi:hypothetical protein